MKFKSTPTTLLIVSLCAQIGLSSQMVNSAEEPHDFVDTLPTTVVSAPRFSEVDMQIASRVQLINAEDITNSGATDLVQLLRKEANLHFRSTSGNSAQSEISMGGFGENSGQRVLILLDGHRLNTADLGQINWLSIPLGLIESVEVIQGGQSALYGNNAVGGVIKINTRRPTDQLAGQAQASVGSFDSYNGRIGLSGREGSLGFSAHAEHDEIDGYRDNSQYEAEGAGLKLDWTPNDAFNAYGSVNGVSSEYGLPGSLTMAQLEADRKQSSSPKDTGKEDSFYLRGGIGFCVGDEVTIAFDGGFTDKEILSDYISSGSSLKQAYEISTISTTITYDIDGFIGVIGIDYSDDGLDGLSEGFGTTKYAFSRDTLAGFASVKWEQSPDLLFSGTFRWETAETYGVTQGVKSDDINDEAYAWSLGFIRFLEDNCRIYGSVRRFYRYPATDEIITVYFTPVPVINFGLKPEWGHELELGGDWALGSFVLGGRIYHQWMRDEVFLDYGTYQSFNLDKTNRSGVDLDARYLLTDTMDVSLKYTWVNAELDSGLNAGLDVPLVPEHKFRMVLNYQPSEPLNVSLGASYAESVYIGGDYANTKDALQDYVLVDLNVRYAISPELEVFSKVDNLLDKEYTSFGFSGFSNDGFYPGVGRSAKIGVIYKF
jgi:iron complex outermembrane receptor protein